MKVLILHQFFNTPDTGGSLRSYYLAKALVDKSIQPVVITTHNQPQNLVANVEGIEVHYLPITYNNRFGFFKRVFSFLNFILAIVRYAGKFRDAKVCYAISTPLTTGVAALWIKFRYRIPYFFEVGDLWPEAPVQLKIIKNAFLKFVLYSLEKKIYKHAVQIVALSESIKNEILKKVTKQVHVIPNMADTAFFLPEHKSVYLEHKFHIENRFVVSYIGTLGIANGLDFLIECARVCQKNNLSIKFIVCGEGAESFRLKNLAGGLLNIRFIGSLSRYGVKEVMNISDAVMVSFKSLPVLETGSPNKYFDGLAAGKLIISNVGGWMKEEIERQQCGCYIHPEDPESFARIIEPFISNERLLQKFQLNARKLAEEKYSRKLLSEQFQNLFM